MQFDSFVFADQFSDFFNECIDKDTDAVIYLSTYNSLKSLIDMEKVIHRLRDFRQNINIAVGGNKNNAWNTSSRIFSTLATSSANSVGTRFNGFFGEDKTSLNNLMTHLAREILGKDNLRLTVRFG